MGMRQASGERQRDTATWLNGLGALLCLLLACGLAACGGAGGSARGTGNGTTVQGDASLTGVAAIGAPMLGARIDVVDARGVAVGTTTASLSDGRYTLTLDAGATLPLLLQASGVDMTGAPQTLHAVVQALDSTRTVAHVTPLTTALTALLLGAEPASQFAQASSVHSAWTTLGSTAALAAAQVWLRSVLSLNLKDAGYTDPTQTNLLGDTTFSANKTGLDIALESVRVAFVTQLNGLPAMTLSNKLILKGQSEVQVDLAAARTSLAASTPAVADAAVTSTLKATTGNSAFMPGVAGLDTVSASLNAAMAAGASATTIKGLGWFDSTFTYQDGLNADGVSGVLSTWGRDGYQLSRWQLVACLDATLASKGCTNIAASALVRDAAGRVQGVLGMTVTSTTSGWRFVGNASQVPWALYPVSWARWTAAGVLDSGVSPNPAQGMQVVVQTSSTSAVTTIRLPSGFAVPLYPCGTTYLCATGESGSGELTGDLVTDTVLPYTSGGWLAAGDLAAGALWGATISGVATAELSLAARLLAGLPEAADTSLYPVPDGLSVDTPLDASNFATGLNVSWATWAAAHPDMRVVEVWAVVTGTASSPLIQRTTVQPLRANAVSLPVPTAIPTDANAYALWLVAQDGQGRRYISRIAADVPAP
ncbi:MAG: hypothetical protein RI907_2425 [Pseudomonadota bacterium]|jgi:hypothetical protein